MHIVRNRMYIQGNTRYVTGQIKHAYIRPDTVQPITEKAFYRSLCNVYQEGNTVVTLHHDMDAPTLLEGKYGFELTMYVRGFNAELPDGTSVGNSTGVVILDSASRTYVEHRETVEIRWRIKEYHIEDEFVKAAEAEIERSVKPELEDYVHIELNNWMCYRDYPEYGAANTWIHEFEKYLGNEEWAKANGLAIENYLVDMSRNSIITAPRKWVEKNAPELLREFGYFLRDYESEYEDDPSYGRDGISFPDPDDVGVEWVCSSYEQSFTGGEEDDDDDE